MAPAASAAPWRDAPHWQGAARFAWPDARLVGDAAHFFTPARRVAVCKQARSASAGRRNSTALGLGVPWVTRLQEHPGPTAWWLRRLAVSLTASHRTLPAECSRCALVLLQACRRNAALRCRLASPTRLHLLRRRALQAQKKGLAGGQRSAGSTAEAVQPMGARKGRSARQQAAAGLLSAAHAEG